jgi:small-conductance mechanosensitive channel
VMAGHVVNFSVEARGRGLILHTKVTIGYDVPWRRVHELLIEAATRTETVLHQPEPFVLQRSLDDFYVTYELNAHTREATRLLRTYSELHANIQDAFNAAGVEIMSPHRFALRDGSTSTVPAENRPEEPAQPFVVRVEPQRPG